MSNSLEVIEHLKENIRQLPPNLVVEVDNFVNELLQNDSAKFLFKFL